MSSLKVNSIQNLSETILISTADINSGTAKAWCCFDGTGVIAIRDSFNISSLVDDGVGSNTVNFTNGFVNANFSPSFAGMSVGGIGNTIVCRSDIASSFNPNLIGLIITRTTGQVIDTALISLHIQGNLS